MIRQKIQDLSGFDHVQLLSGLLLDVILFFDLCEFFFQLRFAGFQFALLLQQ